VTLEAARNGNIPLKRKEISAGVYELEVFLSAQQSRPRVSLTLTFYREGQSEIYEFPVRLNLRGLLMRRGESFEIFREADALDCYIARKDHFRVFAPNRNGDDLRFGWTLWEGNTPHGTPMQGWRELPRFDALGASFCIRTGTESEIELTLAAAVVDHGRLKSYKISTDDDGKRWLTLFFHELTSISEGLEIRWWDNHWDVVCWKPGSPINGREWCIPLRPDCDGTPLAIGLAQNGTRLGSLWEARWYANNALFQTGKERETAIMLRWLRLPILQHRAAERMREYIQRAQSVLPAVWKKELSFAETCDRDDTIRRWEFNITGRESWDRAVKELTGLEKD